MPISDKLIDQLLEGCDSPEDILGEAGLLKQLTKKVAERALEQQGRVTIAEQSYEAALKRWPEQPTSAMGLGNIAYVGATLRKQSPITAQP
ncbi:MAG: tetratricopeptide repeat protein [Idiomarina sp.]|nr:tetratricopeptide repeat protein [Idiomarina sp.]